MKTKEELLKIYSTYLPYELKLQHLFQKARHNGENVLRSWVKPLEHLDLGCLFPHRNDSFEWKPILYSMDMLTKEIEHKGERFVPIDKLFEIEFENTSHVEDIRGFYNSSYGNIIYSSHVGTAAECELNIKYLFDNEYWKIQKLIEWHFNVFGLEESEYIKKETLSLK